MRIFPRIREDGESENGWTIDVGFLQIVKDITNQGDFPSDLENIEDVLLAVESLVNPRFKNEDLHTCLTDLKDKLESALDLLVNIHDLETLPPERQGDIAAELAKNDM